MFAIHVSIGCVVHRGDCLSIYLLHTSVLLLKNTWCLQEARDIALSTLYELASYRDWEIISALPDEDHTTALEVIAGKQRCHSCDIFGKRVFLNRKPISSAQ
jgi:hypothetical protein